jgi:hypothetical protein
MAMALAAAANDGSDGGATIARTLPLESGPKFSVNERVLVTDSLRGIASEQDLPPLYEAVSRKCGLKFVDPTTGRILMPKRKKNGGHVQDSTDNGGTKRWCHLIHYQGWNSRHDRWMLESEIFHDTPENRMRVEVESGKVVRPPQKQKEGKEKDIKKRGRSAVTKGDVDVEKLYELNLRMIERACVIPFTLQTILVDDMEKITKKVYPPTFAHNYDRSEWGNMGISMLHVIPNECNIMNVMSEFINYRKRVDSEEFASEQAQQRVKGEVSQDTQQEATPDNNANAEVHDKPTDETEGGKQSSTSSATSSRTILKLKKKKRKQFAKSIISLFDASLPLLLLYKEEREQYAKIVEEGVDSAQRTRGIDDNDNTDPIHTEFENKRNSPSEAYGAEHLLRFIIKLPFLLSQYDQKKTDSIQTSGINDGEHPASTYILASENLSKHFANYLTELVIFLQKNLHRFRGKYYAVE